LVVPHSCPERFQLDVGSAGLLSLSIGAMAAVILIAVITSFL
jgi:hypothetical protein